MKMIKNRKDFFLLILTLLLAAGLRLYRIGDYMTFLGDEGRDVLVVKHMLEGDLTLLGPRASAGDFYLGPIYYYLMTPFLWLWGLDPVGPAIMVALFGVATVYLVYYTGRKFFSTSAGLLSAFFYAISPLAIVYSRSSWNPNVMPFFTLLTLLILYFAVQRKGYKYFFIVGLLLGVIMQLHYLGTFVALIVAIFTLVGSYIVRESGIKTLIFTLIRNYITIFAGFLIGFSPFLLFEIRNGFPNIRNIFKFIVNPDKTQLLQTPFQEIVGDVFFRLFGRLLVNFPEPRHFEMYDDTLLTIWRIGVVILAVVMCALLLRMKDRLQMSFLLIWLVVGVLAFGLYKKPIYDYYFGFLFPVPFLLLGNLFKQLFIGKKLQLLLKGVAVLLFLVLIIPNYYFTPVKYVPNRQKDQIKTISEFVLEKTNGKPFNFALIAAGNSDHGYRYYFEYHDRSPVTVENTVVDPDRSSVTDQLMIVCEQECSPLGDSLWEVAGFGRAEIAGEWDVSVVKVYKLIHYTAQDSELQQPTQ